MAENAFFEQNKQKEQKYNESKINSLKRQKTHKKLIVFHVYPFN